jgi:hypothetical protein
MGKQLGSRFDAVEIYGVTPREHCRSVDPPVFRFCERSQVGVGTRPWPGRSKRAGALASRECEAEDGAANVDVNKM